MKTKRIIKKMIVVGCCLCFLAGCSAKKDMTKEQTSVVMEDGSVSLKNLYFTNGDDIITDLSGENAYKQFSKMMEKQSNASGNIGEHEFSSFMIESDDTMGIACASFGEDKKLFQLTISPDYSADEKLNTANSLLYPESGCRHQPMKMWLQHLGNPVRAGWMRLVCLKKSLITKQMRLFYS